MGYLAQKKKNARENTFLKWMLFIFTLLALATLLPPKDIFFKDWLFHIYVINVLVFFYALFIRRFLYCLGFAALLIVNYFQVSMSARIFTNFDSGGEHHISVVYNPEGALEIEASNAIVLRRGHLVLGQKENAPFLAIEKSGHVFTLIRVDLENNNQKERAIALLQLRNFISEQDDPVIVFGDFGLPAWSKEMKAFLEDTNLEVKNRILFVKRGSSHSYFSAPKFYILSFQNVGIKQIEISSPKDNSSYPEITAELNFY